MNEVCEIFDVTGAYYTVLKIRVESAEELSNVIDKIGSIDGIIGTETSVVLRTIKEETQIKL